MTSRPITEDDLQAYVDQALDGHRAAEVAAYLADHPEVAARIADYAQHRQLLRDALAPIAREPVPAELNLANLIEERQAKKGAHRRAFAWQAIAATLLVTVGGVGGWSMRGAAMRASHGIPALTQEAFDSYAVYAPDNDRPVEIQASDRGRLVGWGSQRLNRPVNVPDLSGAGFRFLGGRVVPTPHGPALMYMFDNQKGVRIVMLVRNMAIDRNEPMSWRDGGSVGSVSWSRDGTGFSLVGPLAAPSLRSVAERARVQLG